MTAIRHISHNSQDRNKINEGIKATSAALRKDFVALHMDIQIYEMESGVYLVDFKCSGYETAGRRLLDEKDVTSPFPFLDMAAKLIMQLAEAD